MQWLPLTLLAAVPSVVSALAVPVELPTVDLGYAIHQAVENVTGNFYSFPNIRYADPPERFSKPVPPSTISRNIINDTSIRSCPQAYPWWLIEQLATQNGLTPAQIESVVYRNPESEDCLFLDVYVPKPMFGEHITKGGEGKKGAAVLVWIHGGGFTLGTKDDDGTNPSGIIARSLNDDQEGVVFVKLNYRLGLFGWMAACEGVTPNLGLYDQRLALEWVQQSIHLFGGDPERVTVMGESAGGASIMHHITAYGGQNGPAPFQQAITQSAALSPSLDTAYGYEAALEAASNVTGTSITTTEQLRSLDTHVLNLVNKQVVNSTFYGSFVFGSTLDGTYVPDLPGTLLREGKFDHNVKLMPGHNADEAANFAPDDAYTNADVIEMLKFVIYNISDEAVDHIATTVYPDDLSGAYGYTTEADRLQLIIEESSFTCNSGFLARAFSSQAHGYLFSYPPGVHYQDTAFTFFNGDITQTEVPGTVVNPFIAGSMQKYFTRFAQTGNPNGGALMPNWPEYGGETTLLDFGFETITAIVDPTANSRCDYWQSDAWRS